MALTATLIEQGHNRLRYLLVCDTTGATVLNITTTGGASPDLLTDSVYGPVKACALAQTQGLGQIPAGALSIAQARAIWMADNADITVPSLLPDGTHAQGVKEPRCKPRVTLMVAPADFLVDANVSAGAAIIVVTANNVGQAFLDIESSGAIGI